MADYSKDDGRSDEERKASFWIDQLEHAAGVMQNWRDRGDKTVARYRDERLIDMVALKKFNILWSNVQVLTPSLYGRPAKPEVARRFMDRDPVGRLASTMLERVLSYEVEQFPEFNDAMKGVVEDRLLPGRGTAWIRLDRDIDSQTSDKSYSPTDYVYWKDFGHSPARTWEEVWWVARWTYITDEEGKERFKKTWNGVPLAEYQEDQSKSDKSGQGKSEYAKKAKIAEIWNKEDRTVCWIAEGYPLLLDEQPDPLHLEGFFPCPKPLYATMTQGSLIPVPDYCEYQDQAEELDEVTNRIYNLAKAIKAIGVYNSEFKELGSLFGKKTNTMLPVANWAAFAEKQGLKGAIDMLDLSTQQSALATLYNSREQTKQTIYEICGISDILRGSTKAEETLGAQQLKANFGSLRLRSSQVDVARFASDVFRLKSQIICAFYPPELILQMSGALETPDGQDPQLVARALALLKNSKTRDFQITVQSDTLAQLNEEEEKKNAAEMLQAVGGIFSQSVETLRDAPELLPFFKEVLTSALRRYHPGRQLEASADQSFETLKQRLLAQVANPPPSEAAIEAQTQLQSDQARMQMETQAHQAKTQADSQTQQMKLAHEGELEKLKAQLEAHQAAIEGLMKLKIEAMHDETERYKADLKAQTDLQIAEMNKQAQLATAQMGAETTLQAEDKKLESVKTKNGTHTVEKNLPELTKKVDELMAQVNKKRSTKAIRGKDGRIIGTEQVDGPLQ